MCIYIYSASKKAIKRSLLQAKLFQMVGQTKVTADATKILIGNTIFFNLIWSSGILKMHLLSQEKKEKVQREKLGHGINSKHKSVYMNMRKV